MAYGKGSRGGKGARGGGGSQKQWSPGARRIAEKAIRNDQERKSKRVLDKAQERAMKRQLPLLSQLMAMGMGQA